MTYGVGRSKVHDEETANQFGWVLGDTTCFWLNLQMRQAIESGRGEIYVKGCEHAGYVIDNKKVFMEVECPLNCSHRR